MFTFLQQQSFLWPLYKSSHDQSTKNIPYESKRKWARIRRPDLDTATGEISSSVSEISLSEVVSYSSSCGGRTAPTTTSMRQSFTKVASVTSLDGTSGLIHLQHLC